MDIMRVYKSNGSSNRDMAKKKRKPAEKKKKVPRKRKKRIVQKTIGAVTQNKHIVALPVIPAYDFRTLDKK